MGLYDLGGGGGGGLYSGTPAAAAPAQTKTPSKGLFGLGFGPDVNLGLGDIAKMPLQAVGGLGQLVTSLAPGGAPAGQVWSKAGEGMLQGFGNMASDFLPTSAVNPIVHVVGGLFGAQPLKDYRAEPIWTRIAKGQGILPAAVGDIGNLALGAGTVAKVAEVGAAASAGAGIGTALRGGAAADAAIAGAEEGSTAARLSSISDAAHVVAHPYRFAYQQVMSPLTRAGAVAAEDRLGIAAEAPARAEAALGAEAAPAPMTATPAAVKRAAAMPEGFGAQAANIDQGIIQRAVQIRAENPAMTLQDAIAEAHRVSGPPEPAAAAAAALGDRRLTGEPGYPSGTEPLKPEGNAPVGPRQAAAEARQAAPIPSAIQNFVSGRGPAIQDFLARMEARRQGRELGGVAREQTLMADASVKKAMASPEVQGIYADARQQLMMDPATGAARTLPDGRPVTPDLADKMMGDAIRHRGTGVEALLQQFQNLPDEATLVKRGIVGTDRIPAEWMTPELSAAVDRGVEVTKGLARQQYDTLTGGRLGERGLTNTGEEQPLLTLGERRAVTAAGKELDRANRMEQTMNDTRARLAEAGTKIADRETRLVQREDAARAAGRASDTFLPGAPDLFTSPSWGAVLHDFVNRVNTDGGATLNPVAGRVLEPAAFGGTDTGWAVGIRELTTKGARPSLAEWNTVVDPVTGETRGAQIVGQAARDYQKALANGDVSIGLWADPTGHISVDLTQTTQGGRELTRQQARSLAAFRGEDATFDFKTGTELKAVADPAVASHFLDHHVGRDATSKAYEALAERNGIPLDQVDAVMDAQDMMAVHLAETQPGRFKTADDAYRAVKTTLGKDPSRIPAEALLDSTLPQGGLGRTWWNAAQARFPHWEELANWYGRSHEGIERDFRGKQITLLDGSTHDMADVMYDLIALSSVQATPFDNMRNALHAVTNLKGQLTAFKNGESTARALMDEFQTQGIHGPSFTRLAGDYYQGALDSIKAEYEARGEAFNPKDTITKKLIDKRRVEMLTSDPMVAGKMHMYSREYKRMMPVLLGRPLDTWDVEFMNNTLPDLVGNETKRMSPEVAMESARTRAQDMGVTMDEYIATRGQARANALAGELGDRAPKEFTPEDIRRLGIEQITREHYAGQAFAKLRSFRENLASPNASDAVTLDQWMARLFGEDVSGSAAVTGGHYGKWADELRQTAADLRDQGVQIQGTPIRAHHVQALLWAYSMDEFQRLESLAKESGVAIPAKLDKDIVKTRAFLEEQGVEHNVPRKPGQKMPPAQDFGHILDDVNGPHYKLMQQIAAGEGFNNLGDFLLDGFKNEISQHKLLQGALFDKPGSVIKGATWAQDATHMAVRYFQTADPTTMIHENAHVFRQLMTPEESTALEGAYGVRGGNWTRAAEEGFAEDWTRMMNGQAANAKAAVPAINRLQVLISQAWQILKERMPGGRRVPQETADLFDQVFAPEGGVQAAGTVKEDSLQARLARTESQSSGRTAAADAKQASVEAARSRLDASKVNLTQRLSQLDSDAQAVTGTREGALKALAKVQAAADNPSLRNTPAHFQPIWHAYTSLADEAAKTGDLRLAQEVAGMADGMPDVIEAARANGFDPTYIPKMSPDQVRRVVYQGMKLGRKMGEEVEAGARSARTYAHPELMDRSIAGLAAGYIDATHEMHTNAVVEYIENSFVRQIPEGKVPPGWKPWDATKRFVMTGEAGPEGVQVGTGSGLMIPEHLDKTIRSFGQDYSHPVFNAVRRATNPWRMIMLPLRPAWYAHTMIGHAVMTVAGGARLGDWAGSWAEWRQGTVGGALGAFREGQVGKEDFGLRHPTGGQVASHFTPETIGATRGSVAAETFKSEAGQTAMPLRLREQVAPQGLRGVARHPLLATENMSGRLSRAAMAVDEIGRVATYLSGKRVGMTDMEALGRVHKVLVDYNDMSPFEQSFVRTAVPFYAFQKGVLKVAARYAMDNSAVLGITMALGDLNKQLQKDRYGGELPEAYAATVNLGPLGNVNLAPFSSFGDSGKLLTAEGIGASVNPFIKFGASQLFGSSGPGTQYRMTATGQKQEVMRPSSIFQSYTNAPQVQALAQTMAAGGAPGFQSPAGRFTGLGGYSNAQMAQAAATRMRTEGTLQGVAPTTTAAQVAAAGLPATAAQQKTAAAQSATAASKVRAKAFGLPSTRARKPGVAKAVHAGLKGLKRRPRRHR